MGMFNYVDYKMDCPNCGELMTSFQTKDGRDFDLTLRTVPFCTVDNFYDYCVACGTWVEFTLKTERKPMTIEDYEMTTEDKDEATS